MDYRVRRGNDGCVRGLYRLLYFVITRLDRVIHDEVLV